MKKFWTVFLTLIYIASCFHGMAFAEEYSEKVTLEINNIPNLSGTPEKLTIDPIYAILQGEEIQMKLKESVSSAVKWTSSDPDVISCTEGGKVKGVSQGKVTITAKMLNGRAKGSVVVYCAKKLKKSKKTNVRSPFFLLRKTPNFLDVKYFEPFRLDLMMFYKMQVLGYYGDYFYVSYERSGNACRGFVWSVVLPSGIASDEIFKQLSTYEMVVFPGETSTKKLTTNYKGTVKWSVYDDNIVSFDKNTGKVTAKSPGTTIISATVGTKTLSCMVFSLSRWNDPETSVTEKEVKVLDIPANKGKTIAALPKGTEITADGDLENGLGWIHITSGDISGFIEVSDFPGIDYLMTEYHYYDSGFSERYDSAHSKIESYAYILNKIMMDNFNLKICSYVDPFTSSADQCKIWKYGSVTNDNLYAACPKSGKHSADSCLLRSNVLRNMASKKGNGTNVIARCLWTGHILENHEGSGASDKNNVIIFTTRNCTKGVGNQILDLSNTEIRNARLYEIVHETGHLLGAVDGYCEGAENGGHCSNENCYECNEMDIPICIMIQPFNPENADVVFCDDCKSTINKHLKNHH